MISGTSDGNEIIKRLVEAGEVVVASAVTPKGADLARAAGSQRVIESALSTRDMTDLIRMEGVRLVVDATHPYAVKASLNALDASRSTGTPYLRYDRPPSHVPEHPLITWCRDYKETAETIFEGCDNILYTAGTKNLILFTEKARECGKGLYVRVMDQPCVMDRMSDLGIDPDRVFIGNGRPEKEHIKRIIMETGVQGLVTKESGEAGGTRHKIEACLELGVKVFIIKRPVIDYPESLSDMEAVMKRVLK